VTFPRKTSGEDSFLSGQLRAISLASAVFTDRISSTIAGSHRAAGKPMPDASNIVSAGGAADRTDDSSGSTAMILTLGYSVFKTAATPRQGSCGADGLHEGIDLAVGLLPDFLS